MANFKTSLSNSWAIGLQGGRALACLAPPLPKPLPLRERPAHEQEFPLKREPLIIFQAAQS